MHKILRISLASLIISSLVLGLLYKYMDKETLNLNKKVRAEIGGQYASLKNGVVHYQLNTDALRKNPNAELVILVHGFSSPMYLFDPTFEYLVKQGFQVLRFDLFGRGFSDRPHSDYTMKLYVKQLHDLLNTLKIQNKVNLVGLSMGGAIVTHFTNHYPDKVNKISLIDPLFHTPVRPEITAVKVPLLGEYLAKVIIVPKLLNGVSDTVFNINTFPDWKAKFTPQTQYQGYSRAILQTARYLSGKNFKMEYEKMGQLGKPVQLFWGKQDQIIPFSDSKKVIEAIPGIKFHAIDQAGHLPHYEQADIVNSFLGNFLRTTPH